MVQGSRALRELPLCGLRRKVDVIVLARVLVQMGDPAFGQRRRRLRRCEKRRGVCQGRLPVLSGRLAVIGEGRVASIVCRNGSCSNSNRSSNVCGWVLLLRLCASCSGSRDGMCSSRGRISSGVCSASSRLCWALLLSWVLGTRVGIDTSIGRRRGRGLHALKVLLQHAHLQVGSRWRLSCRVGVLGEVEGWCLLRRRRVRDHIGALIDHGRPVRLLLVWGLCRCPWPGLWGLLLGRSLSAVLCQPRLSCSARSLKAVECCRSRDACRRIPCLDASSG